MQTFQIFIKRNSGETYLGRYLKKKKIDGGISRLPGDPPLHPGSALVSYTLKYISTGISDLLLLKIVSHGILWGAAYSALSDGDLQLSQLEHASLSSSVSSFTHAPTQQNYQLRRTYSKAEGKFTANSIQSRY